MLALDVERVMRLAPPDPSAARITALTRTISRAYNAACRDERSPDDEELRAAVVSLGMQLRADGHPPERLVIALKQAITESDDRRAVPSLNTEESGGGDLRREDIYRSALGWCLDAYYEGLSRPS